MSKETLRADLAIIGAGAGGLSVAAGAAQLGLKVVLFERGEMGGDCLNYGCVPSKALIAAAKQAHLMRTGARFGVANVDPVIDWPAVRAHVKGVIATIAPVDSQERFEGFGVKVVREHARFADPQTIESESVRVRARRIVIAAGGRATVPPIPGLAETPYLTNETIFDVPTLPQSLIILGAGAIGIELGQAFRRFGSAVTILEMGKALARMEGEAVSIVLHQLRSEGVDVREGAKAVAVAHRDGQITVEVEQNGARSAVAGTHLLLALGRTPLTHGLDLEKGNVTFDAKGVRTDIRLRSTTNGRVYAIGDIAGREQFTHAAGWHASAFVRTVLFKAATAADALPMPGAVYCDPEIAQIGLTLSQAREKFGDKVKAAEWKFEENDRAQAERSAEGFCRLVIRPGAKILGASIVGEGAGDLIQIVGLAMSNKLGARALTNIIAPYPTRGEIVKRAAGAYYTPVLFSANTRLLVAALQRLP
jgi:pyruvate/2-oxoglutarate dehydrogenase complex dihydrolipoamide dehydrogenase (E3) component